MRRGFIFFAVFLALLAAPIVPATARAQDASPVASAGGGIVEWSVDAGGRSLHAACAGTGSPAVLFEPGGPFLDGGTAIVSFLGPDLAAALGTRFCSYDRAGTGQSDPDPIGVRTLKESAADLNVVLASPELGCPCVVVGESLGGGIALVALADDATGFGGLVLLDAVPPGYFAAFLALAPPGSPDNAPEFHAYNSGENEERLDVVTGFQQITTPADPPAIPMVVVTHGASYPPPCNWEPGCSAEFPVAELEADWQARQQALAEALGARLVVAENTTHTIADENPELVIGLVGEVVAAVRDPSTWSVAASPTAGTPDVSPVAAAGSGIVTWSVDLDGRSLDVACAGSGGPTVLYELGGPYAEGGTENVAAGGAEIAAALGTRFCSYDRAGTSQSDPDPMGVRTFNEAAADLHAVLASPDLGCPCVVIAESIGGGIALIALAEDPTGFGGLVLLSSPYPGYIDEFLALAPAGSPEAAFETDPYVRGENEEGLDLIAGLRQVVLPAQPPAIPIVVVTHGKGHPQPCSDYDPCSASYPVDELETAWQAGQVALADALGARLVVAEGTSNDISGENPELVIGLTIEVMAAMADPGASA